MYLNRILTGVLLCSMLALAGCGAQQMQAKPAGFLVDYEGLTKGKEGQMGLRYINPAFKLSDYDAILISKVQTWIKGENQAKNIDADELSQMRKYFEEALVREVGKQMRLTDTMGPRVLVLRAGITDIETSNPVAGTLSTITPIGLAVSGAGRAVKGDHIGVGGAAMEMEFLDGETGMRMAASVDRRSGTKAPFRGSLQDAMDAFDYWAALLGQRIAESKVK